MTRAGSLAAMAVVCALGGCASSAAAPAGNSARSEPKARSTAARAPAKAQRAPDSAPEIAEDEVERQVRALRQAIALYGQFVERAGDQPEMKDAVERSKQRIEDAQATIDFLLQKLPHEQD